VGCGKDITCGELTGVPFLVKCGVGLLRRVSHRDLHWCVLHERTVITISCVLSFVANGFDVGPTGFE
jgi:hypothetical protein